MAKQPLTLEGTGRYQTSIQVSSGVRDYLYALAFRLRISRTDVLEMAIRELGMASLPPHDYQKLLTPLSGR